MGIFGQGSGTFVSDGTINSINTVSSGGSDFTQEQIDQIKDLLAKAETSGPMMPLNIVHDSFTYEMPAPKPRKPVTVERTTEALLAKPELAWAVLEELKASKLLGPWVEEATENPNDTAWSRRRGDGTPNTVLRSRRGWYHRDAKFCGPEVDAATALAMMDDRLRDQGYILA